MLRILLIIAVALAVIIGLIRLTGRNPAEPAATEPAAAEDAGEATEPAAEPAAEATEPPAEEATDTMDAAADAASTVEKAVETVDGEVGNGSPQAMSDPASGTDSSGGGALQPDAVTEPVEAAETMATETPVEPQPN